MKTISKFIVLPLIFLSSCTYLSAQLLPIFSQYRDYLGYVNPASPSLDLFTMGDPSRQFVKAGGGQRLQWIGSDNFKVNTSIFSGEAFFNFDGVSVLGGGYYIHDQVDVTTTDCFHGRAALYIGNPEGSFWGGLGFSAGYMLHAIDIGKLRSYEAGDPLLDYAKLTASSSHLGVGAFGIYQIDNYDHVFIFGISTPQLFETELSFSENSAYDYIRFRHIFTHLSFITTTSEYYGFFEISAWAKFVEGLRPNVDLNLRYQVSSPFWIGLGGSSNGSVNFEIGSHIGVGTFSSRDYSDNAIKFGYAFAFPLNPKYSTYFGTTHEVNLSFLIF